MDLFSIFMNATDGDAKQAIEAYSEFMMIMNELFQYMYDNDLLDVFDGMSFDEILEYIDTYEYDDEEDDDDSDSDEPSGEDDPSGGDEPIEPDYNRTILIYLDGTDLESKYGFVSKNLLDLLGADIPDNTKVLLTTKKDYAKIIDIKQDFLLGGFLWQRM